MRTICYGTAFALLLSLFSPASAQDDDEFEEFLREQREGFEGFVAEMDGAFRAFVRADSGAFQAFKAEIEQKWGAFVGSTKKDWVEYSEDLSARTQVDFERGEARVEVLVSEEEDATAKLELAVEKLATDRGKSSDYAVTMPDGKVDAPKPLAEQPILAGQIETADKKPVTEQNAKAFAREIARQPAVERSAVTGKDGVERVRVSVTIPLVPDHLRRRAERYVPTVKKYAKRYDLDAALAFAVIHTESYFNPKARSDAPAYGLMQLVPTSGGRAAYLYVYKKDKVLPPSYFYVPEQNVELGCAYLNSLRTYWFKGVEDEQKATYCIVASYNTGAGNVSRAIRGDTKVKKAVPQIQEMTAEKLYAKLRKDLPYKETREYIKRVRERTELYAEWR